MAMRRGLYVQINSLVKRMQTYKQIFISGQVQGVFFRDSTRQVANILKLTGGVRNLVDGRVEVQVAGDEVVVQELIKWLKIGPKFAKVSTIEVEDLTDDFLQDQKQGHFEVWPTR
jgi:acylphosphatase